MLRNSLFNAAKQFTISSIKVNQLPQTMQHGEKFITSMIYDVVSMRPDTKEQMAFEQVFAVEHGAVSDLKDLLRAMQGLKAQDAAMVAIANKDVIPNTMQAVDQIKGAIKEDFNLDAFMRSTLRQLCDEKLQCERDVLATPSPLTSFY